MASFIKKWRKKAIAMYGKARGLTKEQRGKVTAAAHGRSSSKTKRSKTKTNPKKVKRRMARRRKRRGGGKSATRTLFKLVRLAALVGPAAQAYIKYGPKDGTTVSILRYTGYNMDSGKFDWRKLAEGWGPYLGACLATYGIPKITGILRKL